VNTVKLLCSIKGGQFLHKQDCKLLFFIELAMKYGVSYQRRGTDSGCLKMKCYFERFGVLTAVVIMFFWVLTPCRLVGRYQSFRETYSLQGLKAEGVDIMLLSNPGMYLQVHTASKFRSSSLSKCYFDRKHM
jgi:hypothetical protein